MRIDKDIQEAREALLAWYRREARKLPWRYDEGARADPYRVWLSEIMLQQTTVTAVIPYFEIFTKRWPTVDDLAAADLDDVMAAWAGLGYYRRARNLHACSIYVSKELGGVFPSDLKALKKLPGVGDYTAAAICSIAFDKPATVVDGNVERVMARLFALKTPMPALKKEVKRVAEPFFENDLGAHSLLPQAFMDLGSGVCRVKNPRCMLCPMQEWCEGRRLGIAPDLPVRAPKKVKPQKIGYVYWVEDRGFVYVEKRGEEGILANMIGLPTSAWVEKGREVVHPSFILKTGEALPSIHHSFTHFDLELIPMRAQGEGFAPSYYELSLDDVGRAGFPTLFKKAVKMFLTS